MQQNEENIELRLWEYIDGICTDAEREHISALIRGNEVWRSAYKELMAFQGELEAGIVLQEPNTGFAKGVMETIAAPQPVPMRRYINKGLMRGIAAFFIISIGTTILALLFSANWAAPARTVALNLPPIQWGKMLNSTVINSAMGIAVILGLVFLDNSLRVRRLRHQ